MNNLVVMSPEVPLAAAPESLAQPQPFFARPAKAARQPRSLWQHFSQALVLLFCVLASYYLISHFFVQTVRVVGVSMVPNLQDSQFYLLNRWVLHFRTPQRSEIVVLRDPQDGSFAVKRVVGVGGDSVYLNEGHLYVNGKQLSEPYLPPGTPTFTSTPVRDQMFKCGADQYFVLGDNRNNSLDSRTYGPVSRRDILGLIVR